jgi:hypothetical protein
VDGKEKKKQICTGKECGGGGNGERERAGVIV